jgi:hypothetical protein
MLITTTNRIEFVLFGLQIGCAVCYLAAIHRNIIPSDGCLIARNRML